MLAAERQKTHEYWHPAFSQSQLTAPLSSAGRRDGEALATLRPAALEDLPTVLGGHSHKETVGLLAAMAIRLKCTFALHDFWNPCSGSEQIGETEIVANRRRECQLQPATGGPVCAGQTAMVQSVPRCGRRVSPRSFPQLWKKLWKSEGEGPEGRLSAVEMSACAVKWLREADSLGRKSGT
jgi:hypothetical protein